MHAEHQVFLDAIAGKQRLTVKFSRAKEGRVVTRVCAPLDYGPLRGGLDAEPRYQLWDLEGRRKPLNIQLTEAELLSIAPTGETFDPAEIITWSFKAGAWAIARDWAEFS